MTDQLSLFSEQSSLPSPEFDRGQRAAEVASAGRRRSQPEARISEAARDQGHGYVDRMADESSSIEAGLGAVATRFVDPDMPIYFGRSRDPHQNAKNAQAVRRIRQARRAIND